MKTYLRTPFQYVAIGACLLLATACTKQTPEKAVGATQSSSAEPNGGEITLKKMPAGKEYSGFLSDYAKLQPNPNLDGDARTYANTDAENNLRRYIAVVVEPVQVYLASDADEAKFPEKGKGVAARYFHKELVDAVSSAFPVVTEAGPLVLRLRSALIGVDVDGETGSKADGDLERNINIGKVGVEMELVDSESGQQIAAMVDRADLGSGAAIGAEHFGRDEKWAAARDAFNGWARRVRQFLDSAHALSDEDAKKADAAYKPYNDPPATH